MGKIKIQGQEIEDDGLSYHIHIKKPIYGTTVALNDAIIKYARNHNRRLIVSCPKAKESVTPDEWVARSTIIKKVFRYPDNPMILWQGTIRQEPDSNQLSAF
jgi:hypothetical protein